MARNQPIKGARVAKLPLSQPRSSGLLARGNNSADSRFGLVFARPGSKADLRDRMVRGPLFPQQRTFSMDRLKSAAISEVAEQKRVRVDAIKVGFSL